METENPGIFLFLDTAEAMDELSAEELKQIFGMIVHHATGADATESPIDLPPALRGMWRMIRSQLDRCAEKYKASHSRYVEAGRKGGLTKSANHKSSEADEKLAMLAMLSDAKHPNPNPNPKPKPKPNPSSSSLRSDDATAADAAGRMDDDEEIFFDEGEGRLKGITPEQIAAWQAQYPDKDVGQVIRKTEAYMADHPGEVCHCKQYLESCLDKARAGGREHAADKAAKSGTATAPTEDNDDADWRRRKKEEAKVRALMDPPQPKETSLKRNNPEARMNS